MTACLLHSASSPWLKNEQKLVFVVYEPQTGGGNRSTWPTWRESWRLSRTSSPTSGPSCSAHQCNYSEQDDCTNVMHNVRMCTGRFCRIAAFSLWMSRCMSQLLLLCSVSLSTPDFAKMLSRLPPNWLLLNEGMGFLLMKRPLLFWTDHGGKPCQYHPVWSSVWCSELSSPGGISSINRAASGPDTEDIFCPVFFGVYVRLLCKVSCMNLQAVGWVPGAAPSLQTSYLNVSWKLHFARRAVGAQRDRWWVH